MKDYLVSVSGRYRQTLLITEAKNKKDAIERAKLSTLFDHVHIELETKNWSTANAEIDERTE